MKIINQLTVGEYTVIQVQGTKYFGNYAIIDGKEYLTETTYDLPNYIALKAQGDFVNKEVTFHD